VGGDPVGDIAVLKIRAAGLKMAKILKDSDTLRVGDSVIAIGNPLGKLGGTVSRGIISYLGREVTVEGRKMTLIQTDTAVNAGNSGGGLFDIYGNLIGIVNAKASQVGVEGLAFAIPVNDVRELAEALVATATAGSYGYVPGRATVGATFVDGYYQVGGIFGRTYEIVYVSSLKENGAAYKAGMRKEDIILSVTVNGVTTEIEKAADITRIIEAQTVGTTIVFKVKRGGINGNELNISVVCEQYVYTI
ncbi:MAG TPA: PDZ domain-containing protein, partial [Acholeplasmataceae bacterium]|nr:PDZ domain-containing protein [Acholeplasmataceae bacterium]